MILITGATGKIGTYVLSQLISRGAPVRVMARNPAKLQPGPYEVVQGDFEDPASLAQAVDGVEAAYLVTTPQKPVADHDVAFVEAAKSAGVQRIVKLSAIGAGETFEGTQVGSWHLLTEHVVQASGLDWTILKPSSFASNLLQFVDALKSGDPVPNWNGQGALGVIDPRDVAAVAVEALTARDHIGQSYTLTGPELLTFDEQIAVVERVLGRPVKPVDVPLDTVREMMIGDGLDPAAVEMSITGMRRAIAGDYAILTDDVARVLGRAPRSFETWVKECLTSLVA
jgi:uncharacterized protein YbjT (DUF2867 family)